jgi:hypothetical protein
MCGCTKTSTASRASRSRPARVVSAPVLRHTGGIVDLLYLGQGSVPDLSNMPTGAHYIVRSGVVTVFSADVDTLLARLDNSNQPLFKRPAEGVTA